MEGGAAVRPIRAGDSELGSGARRDEPIAVDARRSFDLVLGAATVMLAILTIVALVPGNRFAVSNGTLDVTLNTLTAVAAAGAAVLAWIRYRIERDIAAIYESAAFVVLCATRALIVGISAVGTQDQLGLSLDAPQQWPLYAWSLARLTSALLLVLAAATTIRRVRSQRIPPWLVEAGPLLALLGLFILLQSIEPHLPILLGSRGLAALQGDTTAVPGMEPPGLLLQAFIGAVYLTGALLYRELFRERGQRYASYLSIALVVAAFSQLHWATFPGIYRPLVTIDDLLRALFSIILLLGIEAQFRGDVRALRVANALLEAHRRADVERAGLEASARLAREVHDGLSQDLWLAKLQHARLAELPELPEAAQPIVVELGESVDRALGSARSVVASMRGESQVLSLGDAIQRTVGDFEDRTGIRAEVTSSGSLGAFDDAAAGEIIQILREALTNVRRHADATMVRVAAQVGDTAVEVSIVDNGRGFDPSSIESSTFGVRGMRERAALIGGELMVTSRPADGTRVVLTIPLPQQALPQGAA